MNEVAFKGKCVVVTGSTSGIGLGIARAFAMQGASVMLNGFGNVDETIKAFKQEFLVPVAYSGANLMEPQGCKDLIAQAQQELGSVDVLVNNAGIQHVAPVEEFPIDKWDQVLALNLSSSFHTIQASLPKMKERKWGRIINIASAHGLVASKGKAAYVAAKHGVLGLTKVVALENAGTGVTANSICPGWVLTPLVQAQIEERAKKEGVSVEQAKRELLLEKQPSGEFATVEQVGALAAFLASDAAAQITGSSYSIDGGWTAQ